MKKFKMERDMATLHFFDSQLAKKNNFDSLYITIQSQRYLTFIATRYPRFKK